MEPDEAKKKFKLELAKRKDSKDIVFATSREETEDGYKYHAFNVFGEEIPDYFCEECIKAHPEQYDFSMFNEPQPVPFNSDCKNCKEKKIIKKEN